MYQELHRWDECIAVAEAKVLFLSSLHSFSNWKPQGLEWGWGWLIW